MDFELTDEQVMLTDSVRRFMERESPVEYVRACDENHEFPERAWKKAAEAGFIGLPIADEYGGSGAGLVDVVLVLEEMALHSTGLAMALAMSTSFGVHSVGSYGSEAQKAEILPALVRGELRFAMGLTEPDAGFDTLNLTTRGRRVAGGWQIDGQKVFTTLAHLADYIVVLARTSPMTGRRGDGLSVFLVPSSTPGVAITPIKKIGNWQTGTNLVFLESVTVPDSAMLGEEGRGWDLLLHTLNSERITTAAIFLGTARAALRDSVEYAKERVVFGQSIGSYQAIQHPLAEVWTELEMTRLMMLRAASLHMDGRPCGTEATMAQWRAAEVAFRAADQGIQVLGGHGYTFDHDMQRYWRDSRVWRLGPISPEMAKNYLAMQLGLPKSYGASTPRS